MQFQKVAAGFRRRFLLPQALPIVFYWFYKVFLSTVFVRDVVPSHKWLRTVHPRGEACFPLVYKGSLAELPVPEGGEAAVGHFQRM